MKRFLTTCMKQDKPFIPSSTLLSFMLLANYFISGIDSVTNFTLVNGCPFTVWPVAWGIMASSPASINGFALQTGESTLFTAPSSWQGRFWGRTNCSWESEQNFACTTGGCNGSRDCSGGSATEPVTVVEFSLNQDRDVDFYDVNLMDGFNLPVQVIPRGNNCLTTGCTADLNKICPSKQRVESGNGKVVGCHNANYSPVFKKACPNAYTSRKDDDTTVFTCTDAGAGYNISFCPTANIRLIATPPTPPPLPPPFSGRETPSFLPPGPIPPPFPPIIPGLDTPSTSSQGTQSSTKGAKRQRIRIILIVASAAVVPMLAVFLFIMQKIKQGAREKSLHELLTLDEYTETRGFKKKGTGNHNLRLFTYKSILTATSNFSLNNKLGEGGFGTVYKGQTSDGQDIAVKVLSQQSGQGLVEFKTELILISKLQHVNLVKLHGLCIHGDDKMIIYDYMPNKSLDFFLFSPSMEEKLNWQQRFNIIEGIAQGLLYLHKYSRLKIIHRDLKPSNILLDENMNAKISDFGLARVFERNIDEANTNRRVGTLGYMAPEYAMQGMFSVKSDIYSFGVLVLEIVSGQKNNCFHQIEGPLNLVEHAWDLWRNDSALQLMDSTLASSCNAEQLLRCIHIGLLCVENRAVDRPTSEDVILMLKSEMTSLPRPKNPSFIARNHVVEEVKKEVVNSKSSVNEITLSDIGGR